MKRLERKNTFYIVSSRIVSKFGDILFDYANNTFLSGINPNSLFLVGIYQILEKVIGIVFNIFGGVLADRFQRQKILIATNFISGLACIFITLFNDVKIQVFAVIITNMLLALMGAFSTPSYKALTKEIVLKSNISRLNAYLEVSSTTIKIILPIIAVFLYNEIGLKGILIIDGSSFIVSSFLLFFIVPLDNKKRVKKHVVSLWDDLKSGVRYVVQNKQILMVIIIAAVINFVLSAYSLLLPYSNQMFKGIHSNLYGVFLTSESIGGLLGAIMSGFLNKELSIKKLMDFLGIAGLVLSIAPLLYIISHNFILVSLSTGIFNLLVTIFDIHFFSFVQREVENDYIGRVFSIIFTVSIIFVPLGTIIFTALLDPNMLYNFSFIGMVVVLLYLIFRIVLSKMRF